MRNRKRRGVRGEEKKKSIVNSLLGTKFSKASTPFCLQEKLKIINTENEIALGTQRYFSWVCFYLHIGSFVDNIKHKYLYGNKYAT